MRKVLTTTSLVLAIVLMGQSLAATANAGCSFAGADHSCDGGHSASSDASPEAPGESPGDDGPTAD